MIIDNNITSLDEEGNLVIDAHPHANLHCIITAWNFGVRFYLKINGYWIPEDIDPGFILISDEHLNGKNGTIVDYLKKMPTWLITRIKPFQYMQFSLLHLLSHTPILQDIFKHSPNLVWMIAIKSTTNSWDRDFVDNLLHQKREVIVAKLIGYNSKAVVRFINKIQLFEGNKIEYKIIKSAIVDKELINNFSHWKKIPVQAILAVKKYPKIIKTNLLEELVDHNEPLIRQIRLFSYINSILIDIDNMADTLDINYPERLVRTIRTMTSLNRTHDQLVYRLNESQLTSKADIIFFPNCPLGDKDNIKQIKNSFELASEGQKMHHCVGGYIREAKAGESYFYKVFSPERGTLQIKITGKKPSITQFKLYFNKEPSDESWFQAYQKLCK